jgi:hypothetical protein
MIVWAVLIFLLICFEIFGFCFDNFNRQKLLPIKENKSAHFTLFETKKVTV